MSQKSNKVRLEHCSSEEQLSDIMNKALPKGKFEMLRSSCFREKSQGE